MYPDGGEATMAYVDFSHDVDVHEHEKNQRGAPNSLVTMTNIAGAAVSLALITGVGVWGYKLMVRDVSGVPVVRAAEGDMRVRPEDPGGQLARHQGLAVNEVAAEGRASGPVDQVILAPKPLTLADEDRPVVNREADVEPVAPVAEAEPDTVVPDINERLLQGDIDAVVAELTGETTALVQVSGTKSVKVAQAVAAAPAEFRPEPELDASEAAAAVQQVIDAPGVRASIRPRPRPNGIQSMVQPASFSPDVPAAEIDPDAIPSGTRLVQLGAFESPEVARSEWSRLESRFGSYLQDKSRVIQSAQSSGRTFYRLRAMGFVDLSDARRFCSALKAEGADCIPVQVK